MRYWKALGLARAFVLSWFLIAFALSLAGWFERFSSATLFGIGSVVSAGGFTILHRLSTKFRDYTRARGLKRLTRTQVLRLYGTLAIVKSNQQVLPSLFGIPTGIMDIAIATTSFYVASRLVSPSGRPRSGFFAWHVAGLATLGISALLAILTSSTRFGLVEDGITSQPLTWFPMSLVPTFIGPFVLVCHLLALVTAHHLKKHPK
jgi:hypothetical protein